MLRRFSLLLLFSLFILTFVNGQSVNSQNLVQVRDEVSPKNREYPRSPLDGKYAYAHSGVPIQLILSYEQEDQSDNYRILLQFIAGPYWYDFFWDYGPDQIVALSLQLTNMKTGEIYHSDPFPFLSDPPTFYGNGTARYTRCTNRTFLSITASYDWCLTGLQVVGREGRMFVGPTSPMWTGRSDKQKWEWFS